MTDALWQRPTTRGPAVALSICAVGLALGCSGPSAPPGNAVEPAHSDSMSKRESAQASRGELRSTSRDLGSPTEFGALLTSVDEPFTGDLQELYQRGTIRVLVSYSKSNFFYADGHPRGFEVELFRQFEDYVNRDRRLQDRMRIVFVTAPFDRLLTDLQGGRGDIAAAGLTITPSRRDQVAFSDPYLIDVREVIVANRSLMNLRTLHDLAGRQVHVVAGSSYVEHLSRLSRTLEADGLAAVDIVEVESDLVAEDLLEMVNAGVFDLTVVDHHIAEAWAEVLTEIEVRSDIAINDGGAIGWAVRHENPQLRELLDAFVRENRKGTLLGNILFKRYFARSTWIRNPLSPSDRAKVEDSATVCKQHGETYDIDWLALVAQAYQESGLDQGKTSPAGAVGVLQLLPSTAADPVVGIPDITTLENNIHAGAKYMAFLRDRYFSDPEIESKARLNFAWAAYNAGPARVRRLRREAEARGLDPNRWFENVEQIAAEEIGSETVDYVRNISLATRRPRPRGIRAAPALPTRSPESTCRPCHLPPAANRRAHSPLTATRRFRARRSPRRDRTWFPPWRRRRLKRTATGWRPGGPRAAIAPIASGCRFFASCTVSSRAAIKSRRRRKASAVLVSDGRVYPAPAGKVARNHDRCSRSRNRRAQAFDIRGRSRSDPVHGLPRRASDGASTTFLRPSFYLGPRDEPPRAERGRRRRDSIRGAANAARVRPSPSLVTTGSSPHRGPDRLDRRLQCLLHDPE